MRPKPVMLTRNIMPARADLLFSEKLNILKLYSYPIGEGGASWRC